MIRGDLFKMSFPTVFGAANVICDVNWMDRKSPQITNDGSRPFVNVLNCVEGLTKEYASVLTTDELRELTDLFLFGYDSTLVIDEVSTAPFIDEAKGDLESSVANLFERQPQYGLSKWASLQSVEKFIKAFIVKNGVTPPFTHDLQRLNTLATSHGLPAISQTDIDKIQCPADVRYGLVLVTPQEALEAHHASVKVCAEIAKSL